MHLLRWALALSILVFGLLSHDPNSDGRWLAIGIVLYGVPLLAQSIPRTWAHVYDLYLGAFVVLQALLENFYVELHSISRARAEQQRRSSPA